MHTFIEWKNKCQADLGRVGRGCELRSVLLACLNIADWSNSAKEALEWVNGEHEMHADIEAAISSDLATPYILALHEVAAIEGILETALGRTASVVQ